MNKSDIKLPIKRHKKEPVNKSDIKLPIKERLHQKGTKVNKSSSKRTNKSDNKKEPVNSQSEKQQ